MSRTNLFLAVVLMLLGLAGATAPAAPTPSVSPSPTPPCPIMPCCVNYPEEAWEYYNYCDIDAQPPNGILPCSYCGRVRGNGCISQQCCNISCQPTGATIVVRQFALCELIDNEMFGPCACTSMGGAEFFEFEDVADEHSCQPRPTPTPTPTPTPSPSPSTSPSPTQKWPE